LALACPLHPPNASSATHKERTFRSSSPTSDRSARATRARRLHPGEIVLAGLFGLSGLTALLIRLPYRPPVVNVVFTAAYGLAVYGWLRVRAGLKIPLLVAACPLIAVAADMVGNAFGLYGTTVGPISFDNLAHLWTGALIFPPVLWVMREAARRRGDRISPGLLAFLATCVAFSLSAWYEIVELWDEQFLGGERIWGAHDAPSDLQWNLFGIGLAALVWLGAVALGKRR
jgi:uncharacterized membrane protein YjdF